MRKIIYQCDECEKVLDDGQKKQPHLSIVFDQHSGWVAPEGGWRHVKTVAGIRQFCNGTCLGRYFNKIKPKSNAKRK